MDHAMSAKHVSATPTPAAAPAKPAASSGGLFGGGGSSGGGLFGGGGGSSSGGLFGGGGTAFGGSTSTSQPVTAPETYFSTGFVANDMNHVASQVTLLVCQEKPLHVKVLVRSQCVAHWDVMHGPNNVYEAITLFLVYCHFALDGHLRNIKLNHPSNAHLLEMVASGQLGVGGRKDINFGITDPFETKSWLTGVDVDKVKNRDHFENQKELLPKINLEGNLYRTQT